MVNKESFKQANSFQSYIMDMWCGRITNVILALEGNQLFESIISVQLLPFFMLNKISNKLDFWAQKKA
jgi:antibiotic biosynthesis monooxygenase (ABM) superfamily enzyme